MTTGWNVFVIVLVLFNLLGITWLLWWTSKRRPDDPKPEETSHYWDGDITEYNKPMPRWWINGFYIAIVFGFGYMFWYGGFGTLILSGFQNNFWHAQIFTATLCCVLLAVVFEILLLLVERLTVPWTRKQAG